MGSKQQEERILAKRAEMKEKGLWDVQEAEDHELEGYMDYFGKDGGEMNGICKFTKDEVESELARRKSLYRDWNPGDAAGSNFLSERSRKFLQIYNSDLYLDNGISGARAAMESLEIKKAMERIKKATESDIPEKSEPKKSRRL